jgi:hypothetical protein
VLLVEHQAEPENEVRNRLPVIELLELGAQSDAISGCGHGPNLLDLLVSPTLVWPMYQENVSIVNVGSTNL